MQSDYTKANGSRYPLRLEIRLETNGNNINFTFKIPTSKNMQPKYWSIDRLPGIMRSQVKLLEKNKITDTKILLQLTASLESKQALASRLQLNQTYISKWVALADLARLPAVGDKYCGLLLHSGIISVAQLSQMPFHRLHKQIVCLQVATLQRKDLSPPVEEVKRWVEEAKLIHNNAYQY